MHALLQIIKVNDIREGVGKQSGNAYRMQDCECILLNDDGTPSQVGVLMLPKELTGNTSTGTYTATFALRPSVRERRIEAVLTGLVAVPPPGRKGS